MHNLRTVVGGLVTALISILLTLGVLTVAIAESGAQTPTVTSTPTLSPSETSPSLVSTITSVESTSTPILLTPTFTPSLNLPTATLTISTSCPPPLGWVPYVVQSTDTLTGLASRYKTTVTLIIQRNCLGTSGLQNGTVIYLPALPTRTPIPCGAPKTWVIYVVQPGDTLYRLSQAYGVTVYQLQQANCITGTLIHVGQVIYVPPWIPVFPTATDTPFYPTYDTPVPSDTVPTDVTPPTDTDTPEDTPTTFGG